MKPCLCIYCKSHDAIFPIIYFLADTHLSEGDVCNLDYSSENGLICDPTLQCDACDTMGEEEPAVCQMPREPEP